MRKNRKISKQMSVSVTIATQFGTIIMFLFIMAFLKYLASSRCQHLLKAIGDDEREFATLENDYDREETRWAEMRVFQKLDAVIFRHGLKMKASSNDQIVKMGADGRPIDKQLAIALARRQNIGGMASNTPHGQGR